MMWVAYLMWAAGLTLAYFSLPGLHTVLWALLSLTSIAAIVIGVRRNQPERLWPGTCWPQGS
jgi:hypothetical protein